MKLIKKYLGIVWMALGPLAIYFLVSTAASEIRAKPVLDTKIQWGVFVIIFIPIAFGIMLFGYYALNGEYEGEINDQP
ncbi:DUF6814 family protein [Flavihumibacter fluvii]|uniref:DUF6814 family protein n=1 Tax=Flavihumibacter fluvii TaxID=2838157 RepID=UPI001BDF5123|nr:hypothetical protein [Flavihumibacter fluvii]ULQ52319.1 hypothetical protein KJS93_19720 [Flavihumibacter fluvii]